MAELKRYMGSAERFRSNASCEGGTTAIYDCGPDPLAGA